MRRSKRDILVVHGKQYESSGTVKLGGRTYELLGGALSHRRMKYRIFDRHAGPKGGLRALHVLPRGRSGHEYVRAVRRLSVGNMNLPKLLEYHADRERLYLVLDWVHGHSLAHYLRRITTERRRQTSVSEAFKLFRGLAHGLRNMHHKLNFVHGDIRPSNLILCRDPSRLVLIDFGSGWRIETTRKRLVGDGISEFYCSPEQLQQREFIDFRSDQFSATVVLYELLTQELPYGGLVGKAGWTEYHEASMSDSFVPPSRNRMGRGSPPRRIWDGIDRIVRKGLSLNPAGRYANAKNWLRDIDAVHWELTGLPQHRVSFGEVFDWKEWLPWT